MKTVHITRKLISNGVEITVGNTHFSATYPSPVWQSFPNSLHGMFADSISYIATWQVVITHKAKVLYDFPHPFVEPYFFKILTYSLPMTIFEYEKITTKTILKLLYNSQFHTNFKIYKQLPIPQLQTELDDTALVLLSFGKDSLLTYAILKELKISCALFFMAEPKSTDENTHKENLKQQFQKTQRERIVFFPLSFGNLRQTTGYDWGWDAILSQYSVMLIPYIYFYKAKYLFFGNEQSCNFSTKDIDGYEVHPVYEQSVSGMQLLQDIPRLFSLSTHVGSLIEPIHEIFITWILHKRYPKIAKYQMSCFSEDAKYSKKRWCGMCDKCSWMYIFLRALNIDPKTVGFEGDDMLSKKKTHLYAIFNTGIGGSAYGGSGLAQDEQLLAFYLAYKRGVKGELIDLFEKMYLKDVEKRKQKLIEEYFGIHSSYSVPLNLRKKLLNICKKEQTAVLEYIRKITD